MEYLVYHILKYTAKRFWHYQPCLSHTGKKIIASCLFLTEGGCLTIWHNNNHDLFKTSILTTKSHFWQDTYVANKWALAWVAMAVISWWGAHTWTELACLISQRRTSPDTLQCHNHIMIRSNLKGNSWSKFSFTSKTMKTVMKLSCSFSPA